MNRGLVYILLFFIATIVSFAQVNDEIKLLKDEDKTILQERIQSLEKKFGIEFRIVITAQEVAPEKLLKQATKSIILNLVKDTENKKLRVKLFITKDIDVGGYKEEIDALLQKSSNLVDNGYYVDLIYEITGNVAEIINLIKTQEKEAGTENIRRISIVAIASIFSILGIVGILVFIKRQLRRNVCRYCDIEMDLVDEFKENGKDVRLYSCHVCGHSKKISFRHQ